MNARRFTAEEARDLARRVMAQATVAFLQTRYGPVLYVREFRPNVWIEPCRELQARLAERAMEQFEEANG